MSKTKRDKAPPRDAMGAFLLQVGKHRVLTKDEEKVLGKQLIEGTIAEQQHARQKFILCNLRLVVAIATRYKDRGIELIDLVQEGALGLNRAIDDFDYRKGFAFSTYAYWWIRQAITRAVAQQSRTIRLPVHVVDRLTRYKKVRRDLTVTLQRTPTIPEIAAAMGTTAPQLRQLLDWNLRPLSADKKTGDNDELCILDLILSHDSPEDNLNAEIVAEQVDRALATLPELNRTALMFRFNMIGDADHVLTYAEIGTLMGTTANHVKKLIARAKVLFREAYEQPDAPPGNTTERVLERVLSAIESAKLMAITTRSTMPAQRDICSAAGVLYSYFASDSHNARVAGEAYRRACEELGATKQLTTA